MNPHESEEQTRTLHPSVVEVERIADEDLRLSEEKRGTFIRFRICVLAWIAALTMAWLLMPDVFYGQSSREALQRNFRERGLEILGEPLCIASDCFATARSSSALASDVFYSRLSLGHQGVVLRVGSPHNLTSTDAASEEQLVRTPRGISFVSRTRLGIDAVVELDLAGDREAVASLGFVARVQHAITNRISRGRFEGFGVDRFQFREPVPDSELAFEQNGLVLKTDSAIRLDSSRPSPEGVDFQREEPGRTGGIAWVVDTVRSLPFVGAAPIEWLENRVFAAKDLVDRWKYKWLGDQASEGVDEGVYEASNAALGTVRGVVGSESNRAASDLVAGPNEAQQGATIAMHQEVFPPPPLHLILTAREGSNEGQWSSTQNDPYVAHYPEAPPAFAQTFVRPDRERPYVVVHITAWDTRQVQLRIMAGTREPESSTGERGTGLIPRDERTTRFLVGAFDGGFQAMHGEFGMMSNGKVYLPPKPWAATVSVSRDGRVGMGSWLAPNWRGTEFDEARAIAQIPEDMLEMRQNLTSMVEDGTFNPWQRWWWGAAPLNASEQTFTHRSGLCLTRRGHMMFFWGASLGPEALGAAMNAADCSRSMHLDMNSGHTGFEFYRSYAVADATRDALGIGMTPLEEIDSEWQFDGAIDGVADYRVRSRRGVRSMAMRFPRYVSRDARDFFYLTLRPTLPGPAIAWNGSDLRFQAMPSREWPPVAARAQLDLGGERCEITRIDPHRAASRGSDQAASPVFQVSARGSSFLDLSIGHAARSFAVVRDGANDAFGHVDESLPARSSGLGGVDRDGFLVIVRCSSETSVQPLDVQTIVTQLRLSHPFVVDGLTAANADSGETLRFFESAEASSEILFPDNRPMPYDRWGPLQGQRVRYFPTHPPRFNRGATP